MKSKKTRKPMRPRIREEHREGLRVAAFEAETNVSAIVNQAVELYLDHIREESIRRDEQPERPARESDFLDGFLDDEHQVVGPLSFGGETAEEKADRGAGR